MFAIIDLEWTSWKGSQRRNWNLIWEKKEIIQIGVVKFKFFGSKLYYKKIYVKPKINKNLSAYFQKLTNISQAKVNDRGKKFDTAINEINFFLKDTNYIFCNGLDKEVFLENFKLYNVRQKKFIYKIYNIRPFLSKVLKIDEKKIISSELSSLLNIKNNTSKHDALNDAISIYNFMYILKKKNKFSISDVINLNKTN
jgi:inhibitor of KinA sporulation pathway (predicted exonuclease)